MLAHILHYFSLIKTCLNTKYWEIYFLLTDMKAAKDWKNEEFHILYCSPNNDKGDGFITKNLHLNMRTIVAFRNMLNFYGRDVYSTPSSQERCSPLVGYPRLIIPQAILSAPSKSEKCLLEPKPEDRHTWMINTYKIHPRAKEECLWYNVQIATCSYDKLKQRSGLLRHVQDSKRNRSLTCYIRAVLLFLYISCYNDKANTLQAKQLFDRAAG